MEKAGKDCKVKCFDINVVQAYFSTCGEYMKLIAKPFDPIPLRSLVSCTQSDWASAYKEWGILQFFFCIIANIVAFVLWTIQEPENLMSFALPNLVANIFISYVIAHLGWFAVVKKEGCCCCCFVCFEGHVILAIWGILAIFYGVVNVLNSILNLLASLSSGLAFFSVFAAFVLVIFYAIHGVLLTYMGVCAFRFWQSKGSEVPGHVQASVVGQPVASA